MTPALSYNAPAKRGFQIDSKYVAPLLISCILLLGHFTTGMLADWRKTAVCIIVSILTEAIFGYLTLKKLPHLASAYVSGISCGILVRSVEWWPFIVAPALSIISKYVIRVDGRHIWNPSNLAIVLLLLVAPQSMYTLSFQFGNHVWAGIVIWILGSVIVYRLKRFHICFTYIASFALFALLRAALHTDMAFLPALSFEFAPLTSAMYQLFVFFMITDPKTTVHSKKGQMLVAFLVAAAEFVLRQWGKNWNIHIASHAPYFALTLMGPAANLIEIYKARQAKKAASA
ncbi:RnfABCDGE type electron transport complex subunit D [Armatimonas rosea]|uniref:Na+-translocating ferredoxin:NAD+ oxidoreductase RnfD subunit n=1 Tax=Armatimonas rosea TaxID=685828 RepID=A0A7W9SUD9_ARMRO|nr:RnfABCDGE type electron transport complex subunit D [Armatimonas rosea]MBB6052851.1 Na+-translocating ferredoxin:NAD+ oxidoreductase RnfD subunit [Armatimonas rosea]